MGYAPLSHAGLQLPDPQDAVIPTPWLCRWIHDHWDPCYQSVPDPSSELVPQHTRIPPLPWAHHPSGPAEPQLRVGRLDPHPSDSPCHQALPGSISLWNDWSPTPLGRLAQESLIHYLARNPALQVELDPALQAFQITAPPGSHSGHH
jgi:hypothetical protein